MANDVTVYVALKDNAGGHLVLDGNMSLLRELLATMRHEELTRIQPSGVEPQHDEQAAKVTAHANDKA